MKNLTYHPVRNDANMYDVYQLYKRSTNRFRSRLNLFQPSEKQNCVSIWRWRWDYGTKSCNFFGFNGTKKNNSVFKVVTDLLNRYF